MLALARESGDPDAAFRAVEPRLTPAAREELRAIVLAGLRIRGEPLDEEAPSGD
jgi:hypothetical protein